MASSNSMYQSQGMISLQRIDEELGKGPPLPISQRPEPVYEDILLPNLPPAGQGSPEYLDTDVPLQFFKPQFNLRKYIAVCTIITILIAAVIGLSVGLAIELKRPMPTTTVISTVTFLLTTTTFTSTTSTLPTTSTSFVTTTTTQISSVLVPTTVFFPTTVVQTLTDSSFFLQFPSSTSKAQLGIATSINVFDHRH